MNFLGVALGLLGLGIAVVGIALASRNRPRSTYQTPRPAPSVAFAQATSQQAWELYEYDDGLFLRRGLAHLFEGGNAGRVGPVMRGVVGQNLPQEVVAAQTMARGWENSRGKVTTKVTVSGLRYTAYLLELPAALPTVNFLQEGRAGKAATALRLLGDQNTESHQFNEARRVVAADDRLSHAILTPAVIAAVVAGPPKASLQIVGKYLVSFERGALTQERAAAGAAWLQAVAQGIPNFVYADFGQH